jgi:hypothetical protein
MWGNMNITFTKVADVADLNEPKPSSHFIPNWYKEIASYVGDEKKPTGLGVTTGTIKRCMPVFDSITAGYIITTFTDVWVSKKYDENGTQFHGYEWPGGVTPVEFHGTVQAPNHPSYNGFPYPKWINPWAIKTPKGYSTFFIPPAHRESVFTIFPGFVDTDEYVSPVNFPFVINDKNFEGLIPAGTPIAQVIPIKRDSWKMSIGNDKNIEEHVKATKKLKTKIFDSYKFQFRQNKEYK